MEYLIAAFRSRNVTVKAYNFLVSRGVTCAIVSTPRAADIGCGLSVKFDSRDFGYVSALLCNAETFAGFFRVRTVNGKSIVTRA